MNPFVLQLIITLPFMIVAAIVGIIYFISGYKKGLWRALISLGVTLISIPISVLLANLIAAPVSMAIVSVLPEDLLSSLGIFFGIVPPLIAGSIKVVLASILFVILLFIMLIVLKLVGNKIKWDKLDLKENCHKGLKFGGMGVRALDTIIVTLMLLLPIYGTLSVVAPIASFAVTVSDIDEPEIVETVDALDSNLCVSFYKAGPGAWVLHSISDTGNDSLNVNLRSLSANIRNIYAIYSTFDKAEDMDDKVDALLLLTNCLEDNLLSEEWFYGLVDSSVSELKAQLRKSDNKDTDDIKKYVDLFDMSTNKLKSTLEKSIDLIQTTIEEEDIGDFFEDKEKDYDDLSDAFYDDLGELLNENAQIKDAKRLLYEDKAERLFIAYANKHDWGMIEDVYSEAERTSLTKKYAEEFVDEFYGNGSVSASKEDDEGKAFAILLFETDYEMLLEAFTIHPLFGEDALEEYEIY